MFYLYTVKSMHKVRVQRVGEQVVNIPIIVSAGYGSCLGVGSDQFLPKAIRKLFLSFPLGFKTQERNNNHVTFVNNHNFLLQMEGGLLGTDGWQFFVFGSKKRRKSCK